MAGKKSKAGDSAFLMFDVIYEDGFRSSNRKVPQAELGPFDRDDTIRAILEAQDRKIAELSGRPRGRIKTISKSAG
ncbi:MAG: hypothetical protein IT563_12030 [Alphaproteobacteria bacterium]|nr:hypothetical protein [Alphaproteobacteria bacterium]